ncbi:hypothetical protein BO94DRAFT_508457 [Aspergillus sclerotioniger CBS 115572]|uniref:Uncharacterized protein n=1 Tax=Aspergillus sclerotioniger CBS 115572 TaxID=1450535 RepID=A0A317XEC5_9EURO|nr:hypothetical protein BO94DRAFT_508457 [Aspergillus sclerotioniger CBS 115572]PWY95288.1 hypothetical protein BO94DRAFT_508457 [Aspergillus sclerotioniger CBS 115572]
MSETLQPDANYGHLPFDIFLSEQWDPNAAVDNQQQWESLVEEWQQLTLIQRWPYQNLAEYSPPNISEAIRSVLATHQTIHERNCSLVTCDGWQTIWLRTCYDPHLENTYAQIKRQSGVPGWGISGNKILDDPTRYNFEDDWRRVIFCMPGITDFGGVVDMDGEGGDLQYKNVQNDAWMVEQAEIDADWWNLAHAGLRIQVGVYLVDREAIESGTIKILWLDEHAEVIWENRLDPWVANLEGLTGAHLSTASLAELVGYDGTWGAMIES